MSRLHQLPQMLCRTLCHQRLRCTKLQTIGIAALRRVEPSFAQHVCTHRRRKKIPAKIPGARIIDISTNCSERNQVLSTDIRRLPLFLVFVERQIFHCLYGTAQTGTCTAYVVDHSTAKKTTSESPATGTRHMCAHFESRVFISDTRSKKS